MNLFRKLFREEEGVTLIEYALIAALLTLVAVGAVSLVGNTLNEFYGLLSTKLQEASGG